jgi:HSP20 family protein
MFKRKIRHNQLILNHLMAFDPGWHWLCLDAATRLHNQRGKKLNPITTTMKLATMTLNPRNPFEGFRNLHREMNRIFETAPVRDSAARFPLINLYGNPEQALLTAEIPGVDPADLEITLSKRHLTIAGVVKEQEPQGDGVVCHRKERSGSGFSRTILLPFEVEEDAITAHVDRGILEVRLPRAEKSKPKTITVTTN